MTGFSSLPGTEDAQEDPQNFRGIPKILGPRWAHLPIVTFGLFGVQIFWSVELSYASPYLLSLGLSKSSMAIVFLAGPLSGLLVQPLIGVLADACTSSFGRRRPYMMFGTILCVFAMLLLGFTRGVASVFTDTDSDANDNLTIWLAVLAIYMIDFAINAVQALDRALIVDTLPPSSQASANAWAARMLSIGSVVGFFAGNVNLPRIFPIFGKTQLQVLSVIVSFLLFGGHLMMAILVKERVLLKVTGSKKKTFVQELKDIWNNIHILPHVIRQICLIQFFSWIGWFPVLFYSTIYVGEFYKRSVPPAPSVDAQIALDAEATRLGARALFYSAVIALVANLILPYFVYETEETGVGKKGGRGLRIPDALRVHLISLWAASHFIFAACMFATFFTDSVGGSTFILLVTGFSWAVAQWAPFSLLGQAILTEPAEHTHDTIRLADTRTPQRSSVDQEREGFLARSQGGEWEHENPKDGRPLETQRQPSHDVEDDDYEFVPGSSDSTSRSSSTGGSLSSKAGIILGIHNISIVIPQFLVTAMSAMMFALLDPKTPVLPGHHSPPTALLPKPGINGTLLAMNGTELASRAIHALASREEVEGGVRSNSIVYIFRIGGLAAAVAFVLSCRLARELHH